VAHLRMNYFYRSKGYCKKYGVSPKARWSELTVFVARGEGQRDTGGAEFFTVERTSQYCAQSKDLKQT